MKARLAIIGAIVVALATVPLWGNDATRTTLIFLAYHAAIAQMWNLLAGYAGLYSFGQQLFIGLGGYTLAIACERFGLGVWPAFLLAPIVCGLAAAPIGALTFRLKGGYFAVGTWVVAELFRLLFGNWKLAGFASGMFVREARAVDPWLIYYVAIGLVVGAAALVVAILRSRIGLALLAVRDGEDAASSLGVHVWRVKLLAFVAAGAGTGLASALVVVQTPFIQPNAAFSINWVATASFMVVVGGLGTVEGPIIGAALYVLLQEKLDVSGPINMIILGATSILVMLVAPQGIAGLLRDRGWTLFPIERRPPRAVVPPISEAEAMRRSPGPPPEAGAGPA